MKSQILALIPLIPLTAISDEIEEKKASADNLHNLLRFDLETFGDSSRVGVHLNSPRESGGRSGKLYTEAWKIFASGPLNKDDSKTSLATLDSLVNDTKIGFQFDRRYLLTDGGFPQPGSGTPAAIDYTFGASVGYSSFSYLNPTVGGKKLTEEEFPWEVGLSIGYAPKREKGEPQVRYRLGYKYQDGYKDNETVSRLGAPDGMGFQTVEEGAKGKPLEDDASLIFAEMVYRFDVNSSSTWLPQSIALVPRYTFDFETDTSGVDLPIYFLADKDSNLTGGFKLGWRSDTDDVSVGLFVGTAFDFWGSGD